MGPRKQTVVSPGGEVDEGILRSTGGGASEVEGLTTSFKQLDLLTSSGIMASDIQKLRAGCISTIEDLLHTHRKNLAKIKGLSEQKIEKMQEAARKLCPELFCTGLELAQMREVVLRISTGSNALNQMLGGGIQSMSITEIYGEFRCGKTQLAHTLSVTAQLPLDQGGAEGKVAFIDTEATFRPERIRSIAERFGLDGEAVLSNITYARAYNSEMQMALIDELTRKFAEENGSYRLLIIDSILALFRTDYSGRGELSERQQKLNFMMARLARISEEFNIAVMITNQVQSDPGAAMFAPDKKPVGGHVLAHAAATIVALRKGRGEERVGKLADSPDMPEAEATYLISEGGIADVA